MTKETITIKIVADVLRKQIESDIIDLLYSGYRMRRNLRLEQNFPINYQKLPDVKPEMSRQDFVQLIGGGHPLMTSSGTSAKLYGRTVHALRKEGLPDWTLTYADKRIYDLLVEYHLYMTDDLIVRTSDFNWACGMYNDAGSCYFGSIRDKARAAIAQSNAFVWVVHKDDHSNTPVGRMWSWPLTTDNRNQFFTNAYTFGPKDHFQNMVATAVAKHFGNDKPVLRPQDRGIELKIDRQGASSGLVFVNKNPVYVLDAKYANLLEYPSMLDVLKEMDKTRVRVNGNTVSFRLRHGYIKKGGRFVHTSCVQRTTR